MLRPCFSCLVFLLAATPLAFLHLERSAQNSRPLQGAWEVVSSQHNGRADPAHTGSRLIFKGDIVTFHSGKMRFENLTLG